MFGVAAMVVIYAMTMIKTQAEEHHPPADQALHEKFYSHWNMPDQRTDGKRQQSCCNNQDCFSTQYKREGNTWLALTQDKSHWVVVPDKKLEHNYPDAEESPDGLGHVCLKSYQLGEQSWSDAVFCGVLGSGM